MRIMLGSDLHLEFYGNQRSYEKGPMNWLPDPSHYDVAVLAGDIGSGLNGVDSMRRLIPAEKPIIFVPGNHEFYGKDYCVMNVAFEFYNRNDNVHMLAPGSVIIDDVKFVGATLWSRCRLPGYETPDRAFGAINDFRVIKYGNIEMFSVNRMRDINNKEVNYLADQLSDSPAEKNVVVTHFLPTMDCISTKYRGDALNPYFCNDLDFLTEGADLWLFGHTHERMDFKNKFGTRLVSNPHGYPGENKEEFKWKIIEV